MRGLIKEKGYEGENNEWGKRERYEKIQRIETMRKRGEKRRN